LGGLPPIKRKNKMNFDITIDVSYFIENVEAVDELEAKMIAEELFEEGFFNQINGFEVYVIEAEGEASDLHRWD
jgi:hypothetical protein